MEDRFAAVVEWHTFYSAVAGVAATLVGLLFVALALNPSVMADKSPAGLRAWAGQTFHSFLLVLVIALVALVPETDALWLGLPLLLLGGWGLARVVADAKFARSDPAPEWHGRAAVTRFAAPLVGYAIAAAVGVLVLRGDADAVDWLFVTMLLLIISAASNCWDLLRQIGDRYGT